ncbi:MAG TPA: outer membrane beta-barrel protein [Gemmatimonadaceae bacterium]|nr:outer membrane beta-barrel protein [Gemmatimonadaceae bacterium]
MKRTAINAAVLGLILSAAAAPVSAQAIVSSPVRFGIMGGATIPLSDLSDEAKTGWNAGALVTIGVPLVPVSFRIDGQWHQMNGKDFSTLGGAAGSSQFPDFRIIDGTANVVYTFGAALPTKFYLIGGIGAYNERVHDPVADVSASSTKFGLNAGVGFKFQLTGFATFIEARYHNVIHGSEIGDVSTGNAKSLQFLPISVGITF